MQSPGQETLFGSQVETNQEPQKVPVRPVAISSHCISVVCGVQWLLELPACLGIIY